jgi:hypothetical protein
MLGPVKALGLQLGRLLFCKVAEEPQRPSCVADVLGKVVAPGAVGITLRRQVFHR